MSWTSSWGMIAGAVVGAVAGFFTMGATWGATMAIMTGASFGGFIGGAASMLMGDQGGDLGDTYKPDELQIPTSSESGTVPVVFGTVRISGNYIAYDQASFASDRQTEKAKAGKDSKTVTTGFLYRLTWQIGLCMGPIDELVRIQGMPGEDNVLWEEEQASATGTFAMTVSNQRITGAQGDFDEFEVGMSVLVEGLDQEENDLQRGTVTAVAPAGAWLELSSGTFGGTDETTTMKLTSRVDQDPINMSGGSETFTLTGKNDDTGECTLYPGTSNQTGVAVNGETRNYRHVCYAHFDDFTMGPQPGPRNYVFEVRRMPVCKNSSGTVITAIKTRGSATSTDEEYNDANPAAILWEVFTNQVWGKGMSADLLNQADFVQASEYYEAKRIGLSFSMNGGMGLGGLVDKLRNVCGLATWWDGEAVRCRVVWDTTNQYEPTKIDDLDIIGSPAFNRNASVTAINELRLTFTNRENNHQSEVVTTQNLASIREIGAVRSSEISAPEISTRRCAELLARNLLREVSHPPASMEIQVTRKFASLGIGQLVQLYWKGWRTEGITSYWRIDAKRDNETEDNAVTLTLSEDAFATAQDGDVGDITVPDSLIDDDEPLDNDQFGSINNQRKVKLGKITPILIYEPNVFITRGERRLAFGIQRRRTAIDGCQVRWAEAATLDYQRLGIVPGFAISGTLLDAVSATGPKMVRGTANQFRIALTRAEDATRLLAAANLVGDASADFTDLTATTQNILVVGNEIFRIGTIEETDTDEYTVRSFLRAELGTDKEAHAVDDQFWFFETFDAAQLWLDSRDIPRNTDLKFRLRPFAPRGVGSWTTIDGPDANQIKQLGTKPLAPHLKSVTGSTLTWTITIRPKIHWGGAGFGPSIEDEMTEEIEQIDDIGLRIQRSDETTKVDINEFFGSGSKSAGNLEVTRCEWIPAELGVRDSGMIAITLVMTGSNPAHVKIRQRYGGRASAALEIPNPI